MLLLAALVLPGITAVLATGLYQAPAERQRRLFLAQVALVFFPLVGYFAYLHIGYRAWDWSPFAHGSLVPVLIAACFSLASLAFLLRPQRIRRSTKLGILLSCAAIWVFALFLGAGVVACTSGDCL